VGLVLIGPFQGSKEVEDCLSPGVVRRAKLFNAFGVGNEKVRRTNDGSVS
jgi:hypothetical protein